MKKILLVLAIAGVLVSCSSQDQTVDKEASKTTVATPQVETSQQTVEPKVAPTTIVAEETPALTDESNSSDSKTVESKTNKGVTRVRKKTKRKVASPTAVEPKVEEKTEDQPSTPIVTTETTVDKAIDSDVDKKITEVAIDSKKVEPKPVEKEKSNKALYGAIAAIVVAAGAVVAFKKK